MYLPLRQADVRVEEFSFTSASWTLLATDLYWLLRDLDLALDADDHEVTDELANMRLIERTPGTYRLDHAPNAHDDRVVALALAGHRLSAAAGPSPAILRSAARRTIDGEFRATNRPTRAPGSGRSKERPAMRWHVEDGASWAPTWTRAGRASRRPGRR